MGGFGLIHWYTVVLYGDRRKLMRFLFSYAAYLVACLFYFSRVRAKQKYNHRTNQPSNQPTTFQGRSLDESLLPVVCGVAWSTASSTNRRHIYKVVQEWTCARGRVVFCMRGGRAYSWWGCCCCTRCYCTKRLIVEGS